MTEYGITIRSRDIMGRVIVASKIGGYGSLDEAIAAATTLAEVYPGAGRTCVYELTGVDIGGAASWEPKASTDFSVSPSHAGWIMVD